MVTVKLDPSHPYSAHSSLLTSNTADSSVHMVNSQRDQMVLHNVTAGVNSTSESTVIRNLLPSRRYLLNVLARNRVGLSLPSETLAVITDEEAPGGPPMKAEVRALDAISVKVCMITKLS